MSTQIEQNTEGLEEILQAVNALPNDGGGGGVSVQADWNQINDTAPDFIKNKPFGDAIVEIVSEREVVGVEFDGLPFVEMPELMNINGAEQVSVIFDGVEYICSRIYLEGLYVYGNCGILGAEDTGEPFLLFPVPGTCGVVVFDFLTHSIAVSAPSTKKIPAQYYNTATNFYFDAGDELNIFLYTDAALTTKATYQDVRNAANGAIVVQASLMGYVGYFCRYPVQVVYNTEWCALHFLDVHAEYLALYTAEYTP